MSQIVVAVVDVVVVFVGFVDYKIGQNISATKCLFDNTIFVDFQEKHTKTFTVL